VQPRCHRQGQASPESGFRIPIASCSSPPARPSSTWRVTTRRIREKTKVGEYLVTDSLAAIVGLVQIDVVEIHTWNSRCDDVERPDRIVIDLDPGDRVGWSRVVDAAWLKGALG